MLAIADPSPFMGALAAVEAVVQLDESRDANPAKVHDSYKAVQVCAYVRVCCLCLRVRVCLFVCMGACMCHFECVCVCVCVCMRAGGHVPLHLTYSVAASTRPTHTTATASSYPQR
jgi:hypothetical protein